MQNLLAGLVILLALLALVYQEELWEAWQDYRIQATESRPTIAKIVSASKGVTYRLNESLVYRRVKDNLPLHSKDTINTGPDSTASVRFNDGLEVEIQPNSLFVIDDYGAEGQVLELTFLRGQVRVVKEGEKVKVSGLRISTNRKVVNNTRSTPAPLEVALANIEKTPEPTPPPVKFEKIEDLGAILKPKPKATPVKRPEAKETLPESYIISIIVKQKTFLKRCYAQHLRLNPDSRGRIDTSMTINPDGSVASTKILKSTLPDPVFQQCIVSTLSRVRFKSYKGDPIIFSYPINFD